MGVGTGEMDGAAVGQGDTDGATLTVGNNVGNADGVVGAKVGSGV